MKLFLTSLAVSVYIVSLFGGVVWARPAFMEESSTKNTNTFSGKAGANAIQYAPSFSPALSPLAYAQQLLAQQLLPMAEKEFLFLSRSKNPQTAKDASLGLAKTFIGQNKLTQALRTLRPFIDQDPTFRTLYGHTLLQKTEIALLYNQQRKAESALSKFEVIFGDTPPNKARYHRLAEQMGRLQRTPAHRASVFNTNDTTLPAVNTEQHFFRVGVLLPLSGKTASVGKDLLRGLQMALFEQAQTKNTPLVILYPQDTQGTPQGAAAATKRALKLGADLLIGPLSANNVEAAASIAKRKRVPILAFSSTVAVAKPGVHLLGYLPQEQAKLAAKEAILQGKTNIAALVPSTSYGYEVLEAFTKELNALGLPLLQTEFYNPQNADVSAALNDLLHLNKARVSLNKEKNSLTQQQQELGGAMDEEALKRLKYLQKAKPTADIAFDTLFLPATATGLSLITAQMALYDADKADILLLGTSSWGAKSLTQTPPEYVKNGVFFAPPIPTGFIQKFKQAYGTAPHPLAVLGRDTAYIAQQVAIEVTQAGHSVDSALLRPEGFAGQGGALVFNPNGLTTRSYTTFFVNKKGVKALKPAPILYPTINPEKRAVYSPKSIPTPAFNLHDTNNSFTPIKKERRFIPW